VLKVKGDWITLQQIAAIETSDGALSMTGRVVPAEPIVPIGDPFRRKIFPAAASPARRSAATPSRGRGTASPSGSATTSA
jgi:hypothetical protein